MTLHNNNYSGYISDLTATIPVCAYYVQYIVRYTMYVLCSRTELGSAPAFKSSSTISFSPRTVAQIRAVSPSCAKTIITFHSSFKNHEICRISSFFVLLDIVIVNTLYFVYVN